MNFDLQKSIEIISRTPQILEAMLEGLSDEWITNNEGEGTWSPYDVIGHLIYGEQTDWMVRTKIILSKNADKTFASFDRFAQMKKENQKTIAELLSEFRELRAVNLKELRNLNITEASLNEKGIHPELGEVSLKELLACWVVHDLGHIAQISRVMSKQYVSEVGPWIEYLGILKK